MRLTPLFRATSSRCVQIQRTAREMVAGAGSFFSHHSLYVLLHVTSRSNRQLRSREDENTNLKGHLLILSAELQKRDGAAQPLGRSPSYPPPVHNHSRKQSVSPSNSHPSLSQQNSQGSARGTPISFSRSTPDHSVEFSPSELLARVASMQQQLVEAQVSSLRDR